VGALWKGVQMLWYVQMHHLRCDGVAGGVLNGDILWNVPNEMNAPSKNNYIVNEAWMVQGGSSWNRGKHEAP
jgi:hypothetical protein